MHTHDVSLPVLEQDAGGCGCGCDHAARTGEATTATAPGMTKEATLTTQTYSVTGMTCGHCVHAVTSEPQAIDGVDSVTVDLVADGTSSVTVASADRLDDARVAAALDEVGGYHFAS